MNTCSITLKLMLRALAQKISRNKFPNSMEILGNTIAFSSIILILNNILSSLLSRFPLPSSLLSLSPILHSTLTVLAILREVYTRRRRHPQTCPSWSSRSGDREERWGEENKIFLELKKKKMNGKSKYILF